jgi:dihydrodipicolinate synthase/N-acetylneuraminate lyase
MDREQTALPRRRSSAVPDRTFANIANATLLALAERPDIVALKAFSKAAWFTCLVNAG